MLKIRIPVTDLKVGDIISIDGGPPEVGYYDQSGEEFE